MQEIGMASEPMSQFMKHASGPIDPADPWLDDVLNRRELAQQLTTALSTVTQPFVLGLHGEFGNGKTFFIKRWQQELLNAGDVAVYFNAWETDYTAEPLIAFTAVIKKQLEVHDVIGGKQAAKSLAISAGRIVLGSVLPRAVSLATAGIIQASDVSALSEIADDAAGAASDIADRAIEKAVKRHEDARNEIGSFRSTLASCAEAIAKRPRGQVCRLIIFVDELDRCRPDYAVHVLECVKHFFSVDNVVFVIAIDRNALTGSIRAVYGNGVDVDGYLRKFFDYHVELSPPSYGAFARLLVQSLRLHEIVQNRVDVWLGLFPHWCQAFKLSLRIQEQVLSQASFIARTYGSGKSWFTYDLVLLLLCLQAKDAQLMMRIATEDANYHRLSSDLRNLVDAEDKSDDIERGLQYAITLLLAGFGSPDAIRAEFRDLEGRLVEAADLPAEESVEFYRKMDTLRHASGIIADTRLVKPLGPSVLRRIRFLTK